MLEHSVLVPEVGYWKSLLRGITQPKVRIQRYVPANRRMPPRVLSTETAWKGIESVLGDILDRFQVKRESCLEFGVEYGYSTVALSCFFQRVIGVDTFLGDKHTGNRRDLYAETTERLSCYPNIHVVRSDYQSWIMRDHSTYDLIHVDIIHTYSDTFACGLWSARHAKCVLFHDTLSFPAVKRAVIDIARETGKQFYNFEESYGLGILI